MNDLLEQMAVLIPHRSDLTLILCSVSTGDAAAPSRFLLQVWGSKCGARAAEACSGAPPHSARAPSAPSVARPREVLLRFPSRFDNSEEIIFTRIYHYTETHCFRSLRPPPPSFVAAAIEAALLLPSLPKPRHL